MNSIDCDVCQDLMPLVQDHIASQSSEKLVLQHIGQCKHCKAIYDGNRATAIDIDDSIITKKIKNNFLFCIITLVLFGISVGIMITNSMNLFYNALIMPAIGGFGYLFLKEKAYMAPLAVFLFSFGWNLVSNLVNGLFIRYGTFGDLLFVSFFLAAVYTAFSLIGWAITWCFCFAFQKEK